MQHSEWMREPPDVKLRLGRPCRGRVVPTVHRWHGSGTGLSRVRSAKSSMFTRVVTMSRVFRGVPPPPTTFGTPRQISDLPIP
jgi:hypothetical protein